MFSILSKIITVSESTLIYRKRLRTIYLDYQNEQRTVQCIRYGRWKYLQFFFSFSFSIELIIYSYTTMDKRLIPYANGNSSKYPCHMSCEQQLLSSNNNLFHRSQTQRLSHSK